MKNLPEPNVRSSRPQGHSPALTGIKAIVSFALICGAPPTDHVASAEGDYGPRASIVLDDVPAYQDQHGTGPTAAGMVIGYWDAEGFASFVPGDADTQTDEVDDIIASTEHQQDYSFPLDAPPDPIAPDKSEDPPGDEHESNCLADFMMTSWSSEGLYYGETEFDNVDDGLALFVNWVNTTNGTPYSAVTKNETWGAFTWADFLTEIDAGRPMVFYVDADTDGTADQYVAAVGYNDAAIQYAFIDPLDATLKWADFLENDAGVSYGIFGATFFQPDTNLDSFSDDFDDNTIGANWQAYESDDSVLEVNETNQRLQINGESTSSGDYTAGYFSNNWALDLTTDFQVEMDWHFEADAPADGDAGLSFGVIFDVAPTTVWTDNGLYAYIGRDSSGNYAGWQDLMRGRSMETYVANPDTDGTVTFTYFAEIDSLEADLGGLGVYGVTGLRGASGSTTAIFFLGGYVVDEALLNGNTAYLDNFEIEEGNVIGGPDFRDDPFDFPGTAASEKSAYSIARVDDVNDDGYDEILIGAPYNDEKAINAGQVRLYSGLTGGLLLKINGQKEGDLFGYDVANAGDVDNDGIGDFIVGAPHYNDRKGRAYVYDGYTGAKLYTKTGESKGDKFGYAVGGGADINDDDRDDFIVGAPFNDDEAKDAGKAYAYSGKDGKTLKKITGDEKGDRFGAGVAAVGKLDSDGFGDFLVSAPYCDCGATNAGKVVAFSGKKFDVLYTVFGPQKNGKFGTALADAGRVDSDNRNDFIVGTPYYDKSSKKDAGRVDVISGKNGDSLWSKNGSQEGDRFGWAVDGAGDFNDDGTDDVIVGAPRYDGPDANTGRVYVVNGKNAKNLMTMNGAAEKDELGFAVAGIDDVNDDGKDDALGGAPKNDDEGSSSGHAYLLSQGTPTAPPAAPYDGAAIDDTLLGDLNEDERVDVEDLLLLIEAIIDEDTIADLNEDGVLDELDLMLLMQDLS